MVDRENSGTHGGHQRRYRPYGFGRGRAALRHAPGATVARGIFVVDVVKECGTDISHVRVTSSKQYECAQHAVFGMQACRERGDELVEQLGSDDAVACDRSARDAAQAGVVGKAMQ
ncbi:hypothetical protein [Tsukamurella soli]|uniref:hypothetical protein n=1 Tax=Tsukamurella soli TaxID=644556 RepID=UPI0036189DC3